MFQHQPRAAIHHENDQVFSSSYWKEIPIEVWTHHIWKYLEYGQVFNSIRLVCNDWNQNLLFHARNYLLHVKMNRIDVPSFAHCCKQMYFVNVSQLVIRNFEHAFVWLGMESLINPLEYFPNLTRLSSIQTDEETIEIIAPQIVQLRYLTDLDIKMNLITTKGLKNLVSQPNVLMNLTRLDLSVNRLGNEGVNLIFSSPMFSQLKYLNLNNNQIGSNLINIGESVFRDTLEELHLSNCKIKCESVMNILLGLPRLTYLDVSNNVIGKIFSTIFEFLQSEEDLGKYCKLVKLNLSATKLVNESMEFITKIPIFSELTHLDLSRNKINRIGTEKLADETTSRLRKVSYLDLSRCGIGKEGAHNITKSSIFSSLTTFIE